MMIPLFYCVHFYSYTMSIVFPLKKSKHPLLTANKSAAPSILSLKVQRFFTDPPLLMKKFLNEEYGISGSVCCPVGLYIMKENAQ